MVGLICTGALVSRQDICQERLGGEWRRMEEGTREGMFLLELSQRLGPLPGLAQVHRAFLISLHSGASRHGSAMSPGDNPYLVAVIRSCPMHPGLFLFSGSF